MTEGIIEKTIATFFTIPKKSYVDFQRCFDLYNGHFFNDVIEMHEVKLQSIIEIKANPYSVKIHAWT